MIIDTDEINIKFELERLKKEEINLPLSSQDIQESELPIQQKQIDYP